MMEDSGRGGATACASPEPREIINLHVIEALLEAGTVVIAGGGGGIPVVRDAQGDWQGVQAVIDKDLTSALLAALARHPDLLILTRSSGSRSTPTPRASAARPGDASSSRRYQRAGHFARAAWARRSTRRSGTSRRRQAGDHRHLERALPALRARRHPCRSGLRRRALRARSAAGPKARYARYSGAASTCAALGALCLHRRFSQRQRPAECPVPDLALIPDLPRLGDRLAISLRRRGGRGPPPQVPDPRILSSLKELQGPRLPSEGLGCLVIGAHNALSGHAQPALDARSAGSSATPWRTRPRS